jgi:hypothetical protein
MNTSSSIEPGRLRIILSASNMIGSKIIRCLTWSDWSHAAIVFGDNQDQVVEATYPRVRQTSLEDFLSDKTNHTIIDFPCPNPDFAIEAAKAQIGKKYDVSAVLAFLYHFRDWADDTEWFCSELAAYALEQGGMPLFRSGTLCRVTPQHLWSFNLEVLKDQIS